MKPEIAERVRRDLENGYLHSAIRRLEGAMNHRALDGTLREELGRLWYQAGDPVRAGRYLYFKQELTATEQACVDAFRRSFGNDPLGILKKLLHHMRFPVRTADAHTLRLIGELLDSIRTTHGCVPRSLEGRYRHIVKRRRDS